jgi:hypothetical protein
MGKDWDREEVRHMFCKRSQTGVRSRWGSGLVKMGYGWTPHRTFSVRRLFPPLASVLTFIMTGFTKKKNRTLSIWGCIASSSGY